MLGDIEIRFIVVKYAKFGIDYFVAFRSFF